MVPIPFMAAAFRWFASLVLMVSSLNSSLGSQSNDKSCWVIILLLFIGINSSAVVAFLMVRVSLLGWYVLLFVEWIVCYCIIL